MRRGDCQSQKDKRGRRKERKRASMAEKGVDILRGS
jgi:hypothetical protein